jgi:glycosyltransferase involved in cell wall biosynthesis
MREESHIHRMVEQFRAEDVELLIYPSPLALAAKARIPYVMAIHDLQHRLQPEFPEVSAYGEWERREAVHRYAVPNATLLLADSEVGKEDILNIYGRHGVTADRVKVLPFVPPSYLTVDIDDELRTRVRSDLQLPERYLFYPAQFWPHKNHKRIVQALGLLKQDRGMDIDIVFCGSHASEIRERAFSDVMSTASSLGVQKNIHYLGYISNDDISAVYAQAAGLVMPTFFGPTNIPVLEAWAFGCPVLSSDIRGIREQVQDAGVLVDPRSIDSIADGIYRLWTENSYCETLVRRGRERLATYTPTTFRERLVAILEEAKLRVTRVHNLRAQSV